PGRSFPASPPRDAACQLRGTEQAAFLRTLPHAQPHEGSIYAQFNVSGNSWAIPGSFQTTAHSPQVLE
ncbi:hypothetical protein, partial [Vineibacter terrae]|uniref:hypothetical protein n=1 Tax=Vineibacter terrae TaxID=2586908 RepID=UPI002E30EAA0